MRACGGEKVYASIEGGRAWLKWPEIQPAEAEHQRVDGTTIESHAGDEDEATCPLGMDELSVLPLLLLTAYCRFAGMLFCLRNI
jgi:hypothetical protein